MSAGLISRFGRCFLFATGKPHPSRQARLRGRRPLLFCAARGIVRNAQPKKTCQPKTAKRFFGGPGSQSPSGQAKERTRVLPVRRGFSAPGTPRRLSGAVAFSKPAAFVAVFVTGAPALFPPVCRCLVPGLRAACRFLFGLRCRGLFAGNVLCAFSRAFFLVFHPFPPHFCLSKFFSLVAQAATGLLFLSSLCGVVFRPACSLPSLRRLPPLWRLLCQVSVCLPCGFVCALFVCLLPFPA